MAEFGWWLVGMGVVLVVLALAGWWDELDAAFRELEEGDF